MGQCCEPSQGGGQTSVPVPAPDLVPVPVRVAAPVPVPAFLPVRLWPSLAACQGVRLLCLCLVLVLCLVLCLVLDLCLVLVLVLCMGLGLGLGLVLALVGVPGAVLGEAWRPCPPLPIGQSRGGGRTGG